MKQEVLLKAKELFDLIEDTQDECIIKGEDLKESNIFGTEESFLSLIKTVLKLVLSKRNLLEPNDNIFIEDDGVFWSPEIKQVFFEHSDCWIVGALLQSREQLAETKREIEDGNPS